MLVVDLTIYKYEPALLKAVRALALGPLKYYGRKIKS